MARVKDITVPFAVENITLPSRRREFSIEYKL
jgi:hypothetical protein